ncbi:MAG: hypothetical protein Q8N44_00935 [Rubrivivax sp.]|nr:hypothetical protein [Rubrivivax sp.]MDP3082246.1 hypothetical protein [Rubrivivax sp.]
MKLAEGIRRHGFRKWYERELLQSHGHMALTFICTIGVLAGFESMPQAQGWSDRATSLATVALCVAVGLWSLRRYLFLLSHAEAVAHQADCPSCGTYGRLKLVRPDSNADQVAVCCRQCGHEWRIDD